MAKTEPVVLLSRYTTFAGASTFKTLPIHVLPYDSLELFVWRGKLETGGNFALTVETSNDRENWTNKGSADPGADTEETYTFDLTRAWLRLRVVIGTTGVYPVVTCYADGILEKRGEPIIP